MPKVAFIGAGSTVFTRSLVDDILSFPELAATTHVALMDIDESRLRSSEALVRGIAGRAVRGRRSTRHSTVARPSTAPTTS